MRCRRASFLRATDRRWSARNWSRRAWRSSSAQRQDLHREERGVASRRRCRSPRWPREHPQASGRSSTASPARPGSAVWIGMPMTGIVVRLASTPARCAAPPAAAMRIFRPFSRAVLAYWWTSSGRPVRGQDAHLVRDVELLEHLQGELDDGQVAVAAHHHADDRLAQIDLHLESLLLEVPCHPLGSLGIEPVRLGPAGFRAAGIGSAGHASTSRVRAAQRFLPVRRRWISR